MRASNRLLTDVDRNWATSRGEEEKRAPWRGYNKRSGSGLYLDTPGKDEHRSDTLTFRSTTIDNISDCTFRQAFSKVRDLNLPRTRGHMVKQYLEG